MKTLDRPMRSLFALLLLTTPALAEVPRVLTDIPPVAALVGQVMGDLGQPELLLDKGGDEHDLALRPSQMASLTEAGLVVWVGPDLTPGLAEAVAAAGTPSLTLLDQGMRRDYAEGGVNPHAWLDPGNATAWIGAIAARLSLLDPDNAATYAANATAAKAGIVALDASLAARLQGLKPFLTYHDAYGYFAAHYGLPYQGGLAAGEAAPPSAARIAAVQARIGQGQIACLFPEAGHDPALMATLGPLGPALNPVGSDLDPTPAAWAEVVTRLADALSTCR